MRSYQQLFAEFKRRHVFKVAAIYGAAAFVLLQAADLLGQGLRLPDTFLPFVTALVLIGFPFALILAWAFELTPEGIQKTEAASREEIEGIVAQPASSRWPAGLLAVAGAVALLGGAWWAGRTSAPGSDAGASAGAGVASEAGADGLRLVYGDLEDDERPSIAVLPFADMSPEGDQGYFSDGMTEEILNTLAKIRELRVSGRTSAFAYKDRNVDLRQIGEELGVRYVVEGSVRTDGDQLRITAQLIDTQNGSHLWTEQYDRTLESVFAIQTEIAESIAGELRVPLGLDDPSQLVRPVSDFDAYDLYLAARSSMRERGPALNEAVRLYEAAIAVDSTWAPAWAGLAEAREIRLWYVDAWPGEEGADSATVAAELEAAENAARRALELDPGQASAHVALGSVYRDRYEWSEAERHFRTALQLDPDNPEVHHQYSELLSGMGRFREAVRAAARAASLDPAPVRLNVLGGALENDGQRELGRRAYERGMAADPDGKFAFLANNYLSSFYRVGSYDTLRILVPILLPDESTTEETEFRHEYFSWLESGDLDSVPPEARSDLWPVDWLRFGYPDSAAAILTEESLYAFAYHQLYEFWDPVYDPIRSNSRMQAFLRRVNLEGATPDRTPPGEREIPAPLRNEQP